MRLSLACLLVLISVSFISVVSAIPAAAAAAATTTTIAQFCGDFNSTCATACGATPKQTICTRTSGKSFPDNSQGYNFLCLCTSGADKTSSVLTTIANNNAGKATTSTSYYKTTTNYASTTLTTTTYTTVITSATTTTTTLNAAGVKPSSAASANKFTLAANSDAFCMEYAQVCPSWCNNHGSSLKSGSCTLESQTTGKSHIYGLSCICNSGSADMGALNAMTATGGTVTYTKLTATLTQNPGTTTIVSTTAYSTTTTTTVVSTTLPVTLPTLVVLPTRK